MSVLHMYIGCNVACDLAGPLGVGWLVDLDFFKFISEGGELALLRISQGYAWSVPHTSILLLFLGLTKLM